MGREQASPQSGEIAIRARKKAMSTISGVKNRFGSLPDNFIVTVRDDQTGQRFIGMVAKTESGKGRGLTYSDFVQLGEEIEGLDLVDMILESGLNSSLLCDTNTIDSIVSSTIHLATEQGNILVARPSGKVIDVYTP